MKNRIGLIVLLCCLALEGISQTIQVSWDKTTVLIFDTPIQSVDRGNRFLLSEPDSKALNLLKLKAGSRELPPTNLHVLTEDGNIHAFDVVYAENPSVTTLDLRMKTSGKKAVANFGFDREDFRKLADFLGNEPSAMIRKQYRYGVHFWLSGIYFQDGLLFFDLGARNISAIPLEVVGPEARVLDVKSKKQGSSRETILSPWMDFSPDKPVLGGGTNVSLLMAFPVFTISDRKRLVFYLKEKNGDRELQLSLKGKKLLQAIPLPMFHTKPTIAHGSGEL